jgi:tyrosine decarboxylase / aspartate 1-decarboxylase
LQQRGAGKNEVLAELQKLRQLDNHYEDGRILCSMCTKPHPIAEKAYRMFFDSNLGDMGLFPGTAQVEKEVITQLGELLNNTNATGFLVTGGTEANMMALLAARNKAKVEEPEVILPYSAHFSFNKICNMLRIKPIYIPLDNTFRVNFSEVKKKINKNTVAIVGTAGTAEFGAIDHIEKISEIAVEYGVWLHVDAAFGGLILPFLNEKSLFDFKLPGVTSITIDPHKMGMAAIPTGGILFRDRTFIELIKTETPYLNSKTQFTFAGTRTGAAVASAWAVFHFLGREGFEKVVKNCIKNTTTLVKGLNKIGFEVLCKPQINIVAFRSNNTEKLAGILRRKGWFISYIPQYDCIRVVLMPHTKQRHVANFLNDLV